MDKILIWSFVAIILIVIIIMQMVWINQKIDVYSKANLTSELQLSDRISNACPPGSMLMHGLILDTQLTNRLNNPLTEEYQSYRPGIDTKETYLPYVCTNSTSIESILTKLTQVFSLCIEANTSSYDLDTIIKTRAQYFLMINSKIYLAGCDELLLQSLRKLNKDYDNKLIVNIYAIQSDKNDILDYMKTGCQMNLVPFFGSISIGIPGIVEQMFQQLGIANDQKISLISAMGFALTQS